MDALAVMGTMIIAVMAMVVCLFALGGWIGLIPITILAVQDRLVWSYVFLYAAFWMLSIMILGIVVLLTGKTSDAGDGDQ